MRFFFRRRAGSGRSLAVEEEIAQACSSHGSATICGKSLIEQLRAGLVEHRLDKLRTCGSVLPL